MKAVHLKSTCKAAHYALQSVSVLLLPWVPLESQDTCTAFILHCSSNWVQSASLLLLQGKLLSVVLLKLLQNSQITPSFSLTTCWQTPSSIFSEAAESLFEKYNQVCWLLFLLPSYHPLNYCYHFARSNHYRPLRVYNVCPQTEQQEGVGSNPKKKS